ncbi:MAG: ATP-grasp domain-containing protein [Mycoplasmoidaceae bacterium]|nr:ATP-grasp domain-containing protein [Mycoplasmoidaceae bacterium]
MKSIFVIDCMSTCINYIKDIQDAGYRAIVIQFKNRKTKENYYNYEIFGAKKPLVLQVSDDYKQTLATVKKYNPVAIIPGSDNGIQLALRLSKDLKLPSSDYKDYKKMRDKYEANEALRKAGLRYVETVKYKNYKQALKFFKEHNNCIIVKPSEGTSAMGVTVCKTEKDLKQALKNCLNFPKFLVKGFIMLQELIDGPEYVVNTCSCEGDTRVTSCWKYTKKLIPGYGYAYVRIDFVSPTSKEFKKIVAYDFKVNDAIGVTYGSSHNELKVDKKGPVLIEANCRTPGGSMSCKYLDKVLGHHETNLALMAYINPKKFHAMKNKYFEPKSNGCLKCVVIENDIFVVKDNFKKVFSKFPSYFGAN